MDYVTLNKSSLGTRFILKHIRNDENLGLQGSPVNGDPEGFEPRGFLVREDLEGDSQVLTE